MNILEFLDSELISGFDSDSRQASRAGLAAAFGLPLEGDSLKTFKKLSGGREAPSQRVRELWWIAGRRSEKTRTAAAMAVYLATVAAALNGLHSKLAPGERGVVSIIAVDRSQAKLALNYVVGMVEQSRVLSGMVERSDSEGILFNNRVSIEVHTNSYRAVRGRTLLACILDECAFYRSDNTATPDLETYRAAMPGLATTGGMMIGISSPYARKGLLYQKFRDHFGKDSDDILVIKGSSRTFNPTIPESMVTDAMRDDPEAAKSEWLGEFRNDLEAFISREIVESLVRPSPLELPYNSKHRYSAFTDPAGGGQDEFTLSIAHMEGDDVVIDLVRGLKGTPAAIVAEYSSILAGYKISKVHGDKYGGSWPADEYRKHGITYETSEKSKSDIYVDFLPICNSGRIEIPDERSLIAQVCGLERRTSRSGKDSIDHPVNGHDDRANAVAGAAVHAKKPKPPRPTTQRLII